LSKDLNLRHGKGFSRSNLIRCRQFYLTYPKSATLSQQLSWSHVVELLKIEDPLERNFYEQQTLLERWSVRELIRQKESALSLNLGKYQKINLKRFYVITFNNFYWNKARDLLL